MSAVLADAGLTNFPDAALRTAFLAGVTFFLVVVVTREAALRTVIWIALLHQFSLRMPVGPLKFLSTFNALLFPALPLGCQLNWVLLSRI
jgi:hypothetical protein